MKKEVLSIMTVKILLAVIIFTGMGVIIFGGGYIIGEYSKNIVENKIVRPVSQETKDYYNLLEKKCNRDNCCLSSFKTMRDNNYKEVDENGKCPEGFFMNGLKCKTSYQWCEPMEEINWGNCNQDSDCVETQADCCNCNNGGEQIGINKKYLENWEDDLKNKCQGIGCITLFNCKEGGVVCEDNKCEFKEEIICNQNSASNFLDDGKSNDPCNRSCESDSDCRLECGCGCISKDEKCEYTGIDCEQPDPNYGCQCVNQSCEYNYIGIDSDTSDWQTYWNEEFGFEVKYPEDWDSPLWQENEYRKGITFGCPKFDFEGNEYCSLSLSISKATTKDEIIKNINAGAYKEFIVDAREAITYHEADMCVETYTEIFDKKMTISFTDRCSVYEGDIFDQMLSSFKFTEN